MGVKNHIDNKGFWTEQIAGGNSSLVISGSVTQTDGTLSYKSPTIGVSAGTTTLSSTTNSDLFVFVNASGGGATIILPTIEEDGFRISIKKIDQTNQTVTVKGAINEQKIDEAISKIITSPFSTMRIISYQNKWWIF